MNTPKIESSKKEKWAAFIMLPLLLLGLWLAWSATHDSRVAELNDMLGKNAELSEYPYEFRVFELNDGVATMSSPRSPQSSVLQALKIIEPSLSVANANKPEVIAAQKKLAKLQFKAKDLVLSQPDVSAVEWRLDRAWLLSNGAILD